MGVSAVPTLQFARPGDDNLLPVDNAELGEECRSWYMRGVFRFCFAERQRDREVEITSYMSVPSMPKAIWGEGPGVGVIVSRTQWHINLYAHLKVHVLLRECR